MRVLTMGVELQSSIYSSMAVAFEKMGKTRGTQNQKKQIPGPDQTSLSLSLSSSSPLLKLNMA